MTVIFLVLALAAAGPEGMECAQWHSSGPTLAFCLAPGARDGGRVLAVYRAAADPTGDSAWTLLFRDRDRGHHPWKIMTTELDGDPLPEVAVICEKPVPHDPTPKNRLQVWDWDGERLFPLWLGSRLGSDLIDATFVPGPDGLDRLVSLEHDRDRAVMLRRWAWNGFGFSYEIDLARIDRPHDLDASISRLRQRMVELQTQGEIK